MKRPIETFTNCITLWAPRSRRQFLDAVVPAETTNDLRLEIPSLVAVNAQWDAVAEKPLMGQDLCDCVCLLIARKDGDREFEENVDDDQHILPSIRRRFQHGEIDRHAFQRLTSLKARVRILC